MATDHQRRANRQNARESTGPKSASGKQRSSKNARSHGLTTPPPAGDVLTNYRIILGNPSADPREASTAPERLALALAECEAVCDRALQAETQALEEMAAYLKTKGEWDPLELIEFSKDLDNPDVLQMMMRGEYGEKDEMMRGDLRILFMSSRNNLSRRRRKLERISVYRQRAEGRRRRAFKAWLRAVEENDNSKPNTSSG